MSQTDVVIETIKLTPKEQDDLHRASREAQLSPSALAKKFVLDGLAHWYLERAVQLYVEGKASLSGAAHYAHISVEQMMDELRQRDIAITPSAEDFLDELESMADLFNAPDLREVATELREHSELWETDDTS